MTQPAFSSISFELQRHHSVKCFRFRYKFTKFCLFATEHIASRFNLVNFEELFIGTVNMAENVGAVYQGPVVQLVDNFIQRNNPYPGFS